jgi:hypothetical protein
VKILIEVEVPDKSIEEVQLWTFAENEYAEPDMKSENIHAVEAFVALYMAGGLDYVVTRAEMSE